MYPLTGVDGRHRSVSDASEARLRASVMLPVQHTTFCARAHLARSDIQLRSQHRIAIEAQIPRQKGCERSSRRVLPSRRARATAPPAPRPAPRQAQSVGQPRRRARVREWLPSAPRARRAGRARPRTPTPRPPSPSAVNASTRQSSCTSRNTVVGVGATAVVPAVDRPNGQCATPQQRASDLKATGSRQAVAAQGATRDAPSATRTLNSCRRAVRASEQQIRDVRARDQQDERHDGQDRQNGLPIAAAHHRCPTHRRFDRNGGRQVARLRRRWQVRHRDFADVRLERAQRFLRRRQRLAVLQARHDRQPRSRGGRQESADEVRLANVC